MNNSLLKKLLLVDDDEDTLTIARYCLEKLKEVDLKWARSGEEAIKLAIEFLPDLILLDVMMPKMDGVATFKALNSLPLLANTPVVFFTANAQEDAVKKFLNLGVIDVILKPFNPMTFADTIQGIWNNYESNLPPKS